MRDVLAQPPPFALDLADADRAVGWITGEAIGFRGFNDETEAMHAAWVAHRTLARRIAQRHGMRLVPIDIEPLALERSDGGASDVILASNRPIAELVRPGSHSRANDSFGFELAVPTRMTEFELRGVAVLIYHALRTSGVAWARAERMSDTEGAVAARAGEAVKQPRRPAWSFARQAFRRLGDRLRLTTAAIRGITREWHPVVYK
jgi:hypothetical protein